MGTNFLLGPGLRLPLRTIFYLKDFQSRVKYSVVSLNTNNFENSSFVSGKTGEDAAGLRIN